MARILIRNGRVWDGERFFFADVLTVGKTISKIGKSIDESADFVFDATGKIVSAGLVDIHVHMKGISSENFGTEPSMSSFPFGVTAVNDAGGINGDEKLLDSFAVKTTVFACADIKENRAYLPDIKRYGDRLVGIKVFFDKASYKVYDTAPLKEVCEFARANGLKVMVHSTNSPSSMLKIVETLSAGDILSHIYHGGENSCLEGDFEALKLARKKGVVLDAGFAGHIHTDFANLKNAVDAGFLPDTISTDITSFSAYKRGGRYGMTMCMNMAHEVGIGEEDIFKAVTSTPARVLGKEWGCLKKGGCADIAVFDFTDEAFDLVDGAKNRLNSDLGYRCVLTISDGQVVYRH